MLTLSTVCTLLQLLTNVEVDIFIVIKLSWTPILVGRLPNFYYVRGSRPIPHPSSARVFDGWLYLTLQPVGFVTFTSRVEAEAAMEDLQVSRCREPVTMTSCAISRSVY